MNKPSNPFAKRVDKNQKELVAYAREQGATVAHLHTIGGGVPDIIIGWEGKNLLVEIKNGKKWRLTPAQVEWHKAWKGQLAIVSSITEMAELLKK